MKQLDLAKKRFGRLVAQHIVGHSKYGYIWQCLCDCGSMVDVVVTSLTRGTTMSCGCWKREIAGRVNSSDLTGQHFGKLKVVRRVGISAKGKAVWFCRCVCGNTTNAIGSNMVSGKTLSCGCGEVANKLMLRHRRFNMSSQSATLFLDTIETLFDITIQREFEVGGYLFDGCVGNVLFEIDGEYWHRTVKAKQRDSLKCKIAQQHGFFIRHFVVNHKREVAFRIRQYQSEVIAILERAVI